MSQYAYVIIGRAEKMFNYFISKYKPNNIEHIVMLVNLLAAYIKDQVLNIQIGQNQDMCGLITLKIQYYQDIRLKKHRLVEKGLGTEDQTKDEIMTNAGYLKIYNNRNYKFEWRYK